MRMRTRRIRESKPRPTRLQRDRDDPTITSLVPCETRRTELARELLVPSRSESDTVDRALTQWANVPEG